jgi:hypothetical protein
MVTVGTGTAATRFVKTDYPILNTDNYNIYNSTVESINLDTLANTDSITTPVSMGFKIEPLISFKINSIVCEVSPGRDPISISIKDNSGKTIAISNLINYTSYFDVELLKGYYYYIEVFYQAGSNPATVRTKNGFFSSKPIFKTYFTLLTCSQNGVESSNANLYAIKTINYSVPTLLGTTRQGQDIPFLVPEESLINQSEVGI